MKINNSTKVKRYGLRFGGWLSAFYLFVADCATAYDETEITHNVLHYPPYWVVDGSNVSGLHYNLAKSIYQEAGLKPNFVVMPYARIEAIKSHPSTQVISYGSASADSNELLFPLPSTLIALYSYSLKSSPPVSLEEYVNRRIAVKRGFPLGEFSHLITDKRFFTVQLGTVSTAIQLMLFDRVDFVVTLSDPFDDAVKKYSLPENRIYKTNLVKIYGHPIAINKAHKQSRMLYEKIHFAYLKLLGEGKITYGNNQTLLTEDYNVFIKE